MIKQIQTGLILVLLSLAQNAWAQLTSQQMRPYLSGMAVYVPQIDRRDAPGADTTDAGQGVQLGGGFALDEYFGLELSAFGTRFSSDDGGDIDELGGKLDILFFYSRKPAFSPYFGLGIGAVETALDAAEESSTNAFTDVGLGLMRFFSLGGLDLGLRAEARYRRIFLDEDDLGAGGFSDPEEAVLRLGLVVPLGNKSQAARPE